MTFKQTFFALLFFSMVLSMALMLDLWPPLRGDYGWRWPYAAPEGLELPSLAAILVYLAGALAALRFRRGALVWAYVGSAILPFIFLARWGDPLFLQFTRVASGGTSGPHRIALEYEPDTLHDRLKGWTSEQKRFAEEGVSIHAALAPPGLPLLYYLTGEALAGAEQIADPIGSNLRPLQCHNLELAGNSNAEIASAGLGMLSPFWAALAVFPLFWLVRRLSEDELWAQGLVLLWGLVAGVAVFTPVPNTVFPVGSLLVVACLWQALEKRAWVWAVASGVLMSVLTFLNISLIPLILFCGLLSLGYHLFFAKEQRWYWSIQMGAAFGAGLASLWLVWMLYGGESAWAILHTAMNQHLELDRPYLPWLVLHIWDFGLFLGLPILFVGGWGIMLAAWQIWQKRAPSKVHLLALCVALSLLIVNVSGTARGETGRVWQFFFPFYLISILGILKLNPKISTTSWETMSLSFLLVAQGFATFVIALHLNVIGTGLTLPPSEPPPPENPMIQVESEARFGESLYLTGFGGKLDAEEQLVLDLRWQTSAWQVSPYYVAILPVRPDGKPYPESVVYQPFEGRYPITCWQANQTIIERRTIPLESHPPKGEWWLSISVHDYQSHAALPTGANDHQVGLGPILLE